MAYVGGKVCTDTDVLLRPLHLSAAYYARHPATSMGQPLFRKKSVEHMMDEHAQRETDGHPGLKRTLCLRDLTFMGGAAVIGAGIFSTVGAATQGARTHHWISFI